MQVLASTICVLELHGNRRKFVLMRFQELRDRGLSLILIGVRPIQTEFGGSFEMA